MSSSNVERAFLEAASQEKPSYKQLTVSATLLPTEGFVEILTAGGAVTATLPPPPHARGRTFFIRRVGPAGNAAAVSIPDGGTISLSYPPEHTIISCDGTRYHVLSGARPNGVGVTETFLSTPVVVENDGTAGSALDTAVNIWVSEDGNYWEAFNNGAQTQPAPLFSASGLNLSRTDTNNIGSEYTNGITSRSKAAFTVGTDVCFVNATITISDVSGSDAVLVGFRKAAAYAADYNDYTDFAAIGNVSGDVKTVTALNNGVTTTTDTTDNWDDGETHTVQVSVSPTGAVTYQLDGGAPTTVAAFTFDSGDVIVPFLYFLQDSDKTDATISRYVVGRQ